MWAPTDGVLSGEREVAGVGYTRMRPYLHGLHLKDVNVLDAPGASSSGGPWAMARSTVQPWCAA